MPRNWDGNGVYENRVIYFDRDKTSETDPYRVYATDTALLIEFKFNMVFSTIPGSHEWVQEIDSQRVRQGSTVIHL